METPSSGADALSTTQPPPFCWLTFIIGFCKESSTNDIEFEEIFGTKIACNCYHGWILCVGEVSGALQDNDLVHYEIMIWCITR